MRENGDFIGHYYWRKLDRRLALAVGMQIKNLTTDTLYLSFTQTKMVNSVNELQVETIYKDLKEEQPETALVFLPNSSEGIRVHFSDVQKNFGDSLVLRLALHYLGSTNVLCLKRNTY